MSRAVREGAKTALIAALLISAVLTARLSGLFSDVIAAVSGAQYASSVPLPGDAAGGATAEAARPSVIVITDSYGARAVARYDDVSRDALYEKTGSILNEALVSATEPVVCEEKEWRAALSSPGVMYEYYSYVPLRLARGWLGAPSGGGGDIDVLRLCLVFSDGPSRLYFEGADGFYSAQTASLGGEKSVPAGYDAARQYEFERYPDSAAPYMLLSDDVPRRAASVGNPIASDDAQRAVLSSLGIDARQIPGYTESDGTRVYITSAAAASVSPDGVLSFRRTPNANGDAEDGLSSGNDDAETARRAVSAAVGGLTGDARLDFTALSHREDGVVFCFDYYISGARVFFPDREHAAVVAVSGGELRDMTLLFREYTFSSAATLLPERQALAACRGEFKLAYSDGGLGDAVPFWLSEEPVTPLGTP